MFRQGPGLSRAAVRARTPIISTMDHCPLPASRGTLRFNTPQKIAHNQRTAHCQIVASWAGRAGAVMDGSGLEASFGAGHRRIGFAASTNPFRSCALRPLLNSRLFSHCFHSSWPQPSAIWSTRTSTSLPSDSQVCLCVRLGRGEPARDAALRTPPFHTRTPRRYQVSAHDDVRPSGSVAPPTNHHLGALGPPSSQADRGLLVCRREKWRHASRAHPSLACGMPRARSGAARRTGGGAGAISQAQPSFLCGGGSLVCRGPRSVLLLRLSLSLLPRLLLAPRRIGFRSPASARRLAVLRIAFVGPQRKRGNDDANREGGFKPLAVPWAMRGKQSRTRGRNAPASEAGKNRAATVLEDVTPGIA